MRTKRRRASIPAGHAALLIAGAALGGNEAAAQQLTQGFGLPTGTDIPGQYVLPPGGGPRPSTTPNDPNEIKGLRIGGSVALQEILTDNGRGVASGGATTANANGINTTNGQKKQGDLISRLTPSLSVIDRTPRLEFGLNYAPSYEKYIHATDQDRLINTVTATSNADLWQDRLSLVSNASVSRQFINNQGAVTGFGVSSKNNQTDVKTITVSPVFTQRFGSFAVGQLQYMLGYNDTGVLASTVQNTFQAQLSSGTDFGPLFWQVQVTDQESNQGSTPNAGQTINGVTNPTSSSNTSQRTAQLSTSYALNRTVSLLSGVGYEEISNGGDGSRIKGPFGNFGFGLAGARSNLQVLYNLRYNGQYVSFKGDTEITPYLKAQSSYNESITTTQNGLINNTAGLGLSSSGGFVNQNNQAFSPVASSFGVNSGLGNSIFHSRVGQASITGTYDRNSFTAQVQHEKRTSASFNERDLNLSVNYIRDVSDLTKYNLTLGYLNADQTTPASQKSSTYNLTTGFDYKVLESVTATASYAFIYRKSNVQGQDVRENELLLGVRKDF